MFLLSLDGGLDGIVGRHESDHIVVVRFFRIDERDLVVFHAVPFNITKITLFCESSLSLALNLGKHLVDVCPRIKPDVSFPIPPTHFNECSVFVKKVSYTVQQLRYHNHIITII